MGTHCAPGNLRIDNKAVEEVEKAKVDATVIWDLCKDIQPDPISGERTIEGFTVEMQNGDRGLCSRTYMNLIAKTPNIEVVESPQDIKVLWTIVLEEQGPGTDSNDQEPMNMEDNGAEDEAELRNVLARTEAEQRIREAVQHIQGSLHWIFQDEDNWQERFYRGGSNVFEPITEPWCDFCGKAERSGDCLLSWNTPLSIHWSEDWGESRGGLTELDDEP